MSVKLAYMTGWRKTLLINTTANMEAFKRSKPKYDRTEKEFVEFVLEKSTVSVEMCCNKTTETKEVLNFKASRGWLVRLFKKMISIWEGVHIYGNGWSICFQNNCFGNIGLTKNYFSLSQTRNNTQTAVYF